MSMKLRIAGPPPYPRPRGQVALSVWLNSVGLMAGWLPFPRAVRQLDQDRSRDRFLNVDGLISVQRKEIAAVRSDPPEGAALLAAAALDMDGWWRSPHRDGAGAVSRGAGRRLWRYRCTECGRTPGAHILWGPWHPVAASETRSFFSCGRGKESGRDQPTRGVGGSPNSTRWNPIEWLSRCPQPRFPCPAGGRDYLRAWFAPAALRFGPALAALWLHFPCEALGGPRVVGKRSFYLPAIAGFGMYR